MFASAIPLYLGAKLFGVVSLACYRVSVGRALDWSLFPNSGIVYFGGVCGYLLFIRRLFPKLFKKDSLSSAYGAAALVIPCFHGFARVGCYFGHCCYGAVSFSGVWSGFYEGRIPVQLIEAAFELMLFFILCARFLNKRWSRRLLYRRYLGAYAVFRFVIEFYRGDELRGFIGPLSFSQWIALAVLVWLAATKIMRVRKAAARGK